MATKKKAGKGSKKKAGAKKKAGGKKKASESARKPAPKKSAGKKAPRGKAPAQMGKKAAAAARPSTGAGASTGTSRVPGVGSAVPAFSLPDHDGSTFDSSLLAGSAYVLYFYPKDDTPGCTREACGFRDELGKFSGLGIPVIGVSPDSPDSHRKFHAKYGLNFTLLSDTEKTLSKALGVWTLKKNYGREYMGIQRSTFLVDGNGKIQKAWRSVKVDGHVAAVLAAAG